MSNQSKVCTCAVCPGSECQCGCQPQPAASCQCGDVCNCGPTCSCNGCRHTDAGQPERR